jgi:hypothetical protein
VTAATIPVFAGPSLPPADRPGGPFDWRPPATAGDLLALLEAPPARLCLIDGFFDSRPAPWHKELLLLMARGTLVFGAASMGALRAAELGAFGMIGVGAIYRAYRDGRLQGDDEVALVHGPERIGWAPLTVPMVEVRATLVAACRAGVLPPSLARRIRALVHDLHFDARDWPMMERLCQAERLADAPAFRRIAALHVPLKRMDAHDCLAAALSPMPPHSLPQPPPETCFIRELARRIAAPNPRRRTAAGPIRRETGDGA